MQELIKKIAEIYVKYGIRSVTMDDLARELSISKKTLYQYFKDKNDVVAQVIQHILKEQKCGIEQVLEKEKINAIEQLMMITSFLARTLQTSNASLTYDLQKYYPDIWQEVVSFKREEVYDHIMDNINQGISEGIYRTDLNYEIIAHAYVSRMEMYQTDLWKPMEKYPLEEVFYTLFIYHIRGIASEKGLKYLDAQHDKWDIAKNNP